MEDTIVIIPTLNEEENIGQIIPAILASCPGVSVLVVDDNSRDRTQEIVRKLSDLGVKPPSKVFLLARRANPGYGRSILDGLRWALEHGYEIAISMDSDFSHDPKYLPDLHKLIMGGCELAIGSRYVRGGGVMNWKWYRKFLSRFANLYVRVILKLPVKDATSGFVAHSDKAMQALLAREPRSEGYSFLVETKYILRKMRACELPIIFTDRREGKSKMSAGKIWESVWMPWRLLFNSLI